MENNLKFFLYSKFFYNTCSKKKYIEKPKKIIYNIDLQIKVVSKIAEIVANVISALDAGQFCKQHTEYQLIEQG